jgi:hypothetical protein
VLWCLHSPRHWQHDTYRSCICCRTPACCPFPLAPLLCAQVCRAAQAALSADRKEQRLQEAAERRRQGDKLAVPNPLDLMARR